LSGANADIYGQVVEVAVGITVAVVIKLIDSHGALYMDVHLEIIAGQTLTFRQILQESMQS
jgi:hypothetical protein